MSDFLVLEKRISDVVLVWESAPQSPLPRALRKIFRYLLFQQQRVAEAAVAVAKRTGREN